MNNDSPTTFWTWFSVPIGSEELDLSDCGLLDADEDDLYDLISPSTTFLYGTEKEARHAALSTADPDDVTAGTWEPHNDGSRFVTPYYTWYTYKMVVKQP